MNTQALFHYFCRSNSAAVAVNEYSTAQKQRLQGRRCNF